MCGIVGIVRFDGAPLDLALIKQATGALAHRGPDDSGYYLSSTTPVALGHRRLSILDLSPAGHQPMVGCRPDLLLAYNGEIYNYAALRQELAACGYRFRSECDSEVLLHATDRWSGDAPRRLNGMFAYAVLDEHAGTLTLVRDRFGIKPLYYYRDARVLVFASEIKAIIATGLYHPEVLLEALPEYLTFRTVAGERTLLKDVVELTPGTQLTVNLYGGAITAETFHEIRVRPEPIDPRAAEEELRQRLTQAVRLQLRSDVPVGTMNSGGLDSSVISALTVASGMSSLRTYCASYGGAEGGAFDESNYAELLAEQLHTRHREIATGPDEFFSQIESACWSFDEPLSHPNSIPLLKVFKEARADGVKVMLSGEGGDEMFAGYDFFTELAVISCLAKARPAWLVTPAVRAAVRLTGSSRWSQLVDAWVMERAGAVVDVIAVERQAGLRTEERWGPYRQRLVESFNGDLFASGSEYVQHVYLPPLLQRSDRMSMASGVECRVPYLDNDVADLANRLPQPLKRRLFPRREGKILLRRVASGLVPDAIINRQKYGFAVPFSAWLRNTPAGADAMGILREPRARARPWVAGVALDRFTQEHASGVVDAGRRIWTLLTLELWARGFVDHGGRAVAAQWALR